MSKVFLVYGPACSGKNTYVNEHKEENDLIIDFDALHMAITGNESHNHNPDVFKYVYEARDKLLEIYKEFGHQGNLWIINSAPRQSQRDFFVDEFDAELVFIDTDKDTCLDRAKTDRPEEWQQYIENWFNDYEPDVRSHDGIEVPDYIRENAAKGLKFYEEGFGGDGLVARTIAEAKLMAEGHVTLDKAKRMAAWFARHESDLNSDGAKEYLNNNGDPSPSIVAWYLWGGNPADEFRMGAARWAERQYDNEDRGADKFARTTKGILMENRELRFIVHNFETREDENIGVIGGYASVFDSPSQVLGGGFIEYINRGAFTKTIAERGNNPAARSDILCFWNHDSNIVLGSKRAGSLRLQEDQVGLAYECDLDLRNSMARDVYYMISRDCGGTSFGFECLEDSWELGAENEPMKRYIHSVRLYEVSPTAQPAYTSSDSHIVRSLQSLSKASGLDLRDLVKAAENDQLKEAIEHQTKKTDDHNIKIKASARSRQLDLLKK